KSLDLIFFLIAAFNSILLYFLSSFVLVFNEIIEIYDLLKFSLLENDLFSASNLYTAVTLEFLTTFVLLASLDHNSKSSPLDKFSLNPLFSLKSLLFTTNILVHMTAPK